MQNPRLRMPGRNESAANKKTGLCAMPVFHGARQRADCAGMRSGSFKQAAQHPGGFFMHIHALRQQIAGWLVVGGICRLKHLARRAGRCFLCHDEMLHHLHCSGHTLHLLDGGKLDKLLVGAGRGNAQRTDALGNHVQRIPLLGVLLHEHGVQAVEMRARHVPVEIVGHQVQGVAVGQQCRQTIGDFLAVLGVNADVDRKSGRGLFAGHRNSFHSLIKPEHRYVLKCSAARLTRQATLSPLNRPHLHVLYLTITRHPRNAAPAPTPLCVFF